MNNKLFKLGALLVVLMLFVGANAFAQLSTVYVDVTNGSSGNTGENVTNNPPGTGPKGTISDGLLALANNGTLVILGGSYNGVDNAGGNVDINTTTYTRLTGGLTIELRTLLSNNQVLLSAGNFIFNVSGGILNITTTNGTEFFTLGAGAATLTLGGGANSSAMNIPNSTFFQLPSGSSIVMNTTSSFSNAAPQRTTNVNLTYQGGGNPTAGPEANYGSYGAGSIAISKTAGTTVTFPYAITAVGGIGVTSGNATFAQTVAMGLYDITNSNTGALIFNGAVTFAMSQGAGNANLGSVVNTAGGTITFNGTATWTAGTFTGANVFAPAAGTYVIDNQAAGNIVFNGAISLVNSQATAGWHATFTANNGSGGTLTLASVTANTAGVGLTYVILNAQNTAASGTLNIAGGNYRGFLTNGNATGTVNVTGATTVAGILTNAGTGTAGIALGGNVLTLSGAVTHATTGGVITATAGGGLTVSGNGTFNGGTLSSVTVVSGKTATISGNAIVTNLTATGNVIVNTATTLQANGSVTETGDITLTGSAGLLIKGDFNRTSGTFTATLGAGSTVTFNGTTAQAVNSGPNFQVENLTFANSGGVVTLGASIRAWALVTIGASNNIALGTLNIILNSATAAMVNNGTYSAAGGGGVIVGGSNLVVGGYTGAMAPALSGSGKYSYITIDVGPPVGNTVALAGSIKFTGVLTLRSGTFATGANDISPFGTAASVVRWVQSAAAINTAGGTFDFDAVDYDLTYTETLTGVASVTAGSSEFATANIRNLTVSTTAFTLTLVGGPITVKGDMTLSASALFVLPATNFTVNGALTVNASADMSGGNIANTFTLDGDGKTHTVAGTISAADVFKVTSAGSTLNGSTTTAHAAQIDNLAFEPVTNGSAFTSNNLKVINTGPVTIQGTSTATGVTATIVMNAVTATLNGGLNVGNGAITPTVSVTVAGTTTSLFPGAVTVTNGALTLTRGGGAAATFNIGGAITITAGSLTLGSNLNATVATSQVAGDLILGSFNFKQIATNYVRTGAGALTAGTGQLIMDANGVGTTLTPGATFTVPNLTFVDAVGGFTNVVAAAMTVSNTLKHTSDAVTLPAAGLTLSGNVYTYTAGTYTGGKLIFTGNAAVGTFAGNVTIPNVQVNSTGSLTVETSDLTTPTYRTITISGALTQTAGDIAIGGNTIVLTGGAASFVRVAGAWTMSTGLLNFNGAGLTFTPGTGWAVDNLTVTQAAGETTPNSAFTVNKYLTLVAGTFTTTFSGTTGMLTLGDNATIERQNNTAVLDLAPTFGATMVNLKYSTAAGIISAKEVPAANIIQNFTVTAASGVVLTTSIQINNTLDLAALLDATTNTKTVTMAANSTLMLRVVGTPTALDKNLNLLGALNIIYNNAVGFSTSPRELGVLTSGAHLLPTGNVTFQGGGLFTTDGAITFGGTLTFNGGSLNASGKAMNVQGNLVQTANGGFFASTAASVISFTGLNTTLTLNAAQVVGAFDMLTINKTASANTLTLSGGDLKFTSSTIPPVPPNNATLYFVNGVLVTGGTSNVVLQQYATGNATVPTTGQPTQGFDRSGVTGSNESHVYGRVKKYINNDGNHNVDISVVTFPVGALTPTPYYRPMTYYFKSNPQSSINLTVTEVDQNAGGMSGFPITAGGLTITNFPPFFWYAKSDIPLAPSYQFDVEAQAKGYSDYFQDGIANIRLVRRDSGSVSNTWILQGNQNTYPPTYIYDNSAIATDWPLVKAINATGGITLQGSIFSYSQSDKPPAFTAAPASVTIKESQVFSGTYAAADPDLNQGVVLSVQATNITGYTFNATTGAFSWTSGFFDAGAKTLTIRATATNSTAPTDYKDTTITITVQDSLRLPTFSHVPNDTSVIARIPLMLTWTATSLDTDRVKSPANPLKYFIVSVTPTPATAPTLDSLTGVFNWTPAISDTAVHVLIVRVTDGVYDVNSTKNITVQKTRRLPYFTASLGATLNANMGSTVNFTYVAADSDGIAITYSLVQGPTGATLVGGVFTYAVPFSVPGTYIDTVIVGASNGTLTATAQTIVTRVYQNGSPSFTAEMTDRTLYVGDTLQFTYAATDPNGDALKFYKIQYPQGASVDSVTGKFFWIAASQQTAIYVIKTYVVDGQGGADTTFAQVMVQVVQVNVTGTVTYGTGAVPVSGATVTITRTDAPGVTTLTTNTNGAYTTSPNKLNSGNYSFAFTKTGNHPTVYTNAADALKAALYFSNPTAYPLSALQLLAADVNNDAVVNSADALQIMLRYVGSITSFTKGDWVFIPQLSTVVLTTTDKVDNATGLAVGDVNADAQAGGSYFAKASGPQSVVAQTGSVMRVSNSDVFEVPVRVKTASSLGSFSMAFQYSPDAASFVGVRGPEGMVSASNNGMVAVAWMNTERSMNLKDGDAIVTLRFKPTTDAKDFSLTLDPNSQVTDAQAKVLEGINVEIPAVDASIPTVFALGQNYPNPFNPSTTIQYDIPVAGHVTMVVYNMLGQVVDRLVDDQQNPGTYKVRWDASKMSSGIYMYHITVDAGKQTFKEVRRMVLLK